MPNWKKLIVSGSDASLNSLNVTNNVTAQSFTGSFSGSFTAPGATTQVVYNNGGVLAANSGFVYSGSNVGIGTTNPSYKLNVYESNTAEYISAKFQTTHPNLNYILLQNGGGSFNHYIQTNSGTLGLSADENGSSGVIQLKTNNVIAVTVNTSQNVGIGTTSPATKLDLVGSYKQTQASGGVGLYHITTPNADQVQGVWDLYTDTAVTPDFFGRFGFKFEGGASNTYRQFQVYVGDASTPKFIVNGSGNVGIGTTNPSEKLTVGNGNIVISGSDSTNYLIGVKSLNSNNDINGGLEVYQINGWGSKVGIKTGRANGGWGGQYALYSETVDDANLSYPSQSAHTKFNSKTTASYGPAVVYIDSGSGGTIPSIHTYNGAAFAISTGSVGIGTTSPTAKLEVNGNVKATSFTGSFSGSVSAPGATTQIVYNDNGVLAASSGLVYSGSNVGIGISSPTEKLHIVSSATGNQFGRITATDSNSSAAWVAQNDSGDNVVYRVFSSGVSGTQMGAALGRSASLLANLGGSGVFLLGTFSNTNFVLGTNNTENMRITTAGNVGIGTSSPAYLLDVNGTARVGASGGSGQLYIKGFAGTGQYLYLDDGSKVWSLVGGTDYGIQENGTARLTVKGGGNVGIGTTSPASILHVEAGSPTTNLIASSGNGFLRIADSATSATRKEFTILLDNTNNRVDIQAIQQGVAARNITLNASGGNVGIGTTSPSQVLEVQGQAQIGNDSVTSAGLFIARKNTNQAKSHYFLSAQESPTYQWIEGGYFTSELAGVSVANNSGKPYYESYSPAGQYKSFGFINQTTSGSSFTSTAATASMTLFQGGNIALAYNGGNVGIGTSSPGAKLQVVGGEIRVDAGQAITLDVANTMYLVGASNQLRLYNGGNPVVNITTGGNVGIGTTSPGYKLEVVGAVSASTYYGDGSNLTNIGSGSVSAAGSDGQLQYNNSGLFGGASRLYYNDSTNRVGIGTSSPGYDLDVSGSARVQDRLRVGVVNTGNGVIHQSSDATINPLSSTIVWSVPGSAGICAFIEYYVFNSNTGTSQRAGNIVTTWNSAGTPQITHTETTTPDIGTTALVTFTTSITLGGDPQLVATNTSGDTWYMIMNYRYF